MNVLHIAGGLPTLEKPFYQPFIKSQIDSLISKGLNIITLDLKGYESSWNYLKGIKKIQEIVNSNNIDLIHAHYTYCGISAILARCKIPIVLSLMGSDLLGSPNKNGKNTLRGRIDILLTRIVIKFVDRIIVKSNGMKKKIKTKIPVDVIPNGVNFNNFKPIDKSEAREKLNLDKKTFFILFLGNPKLYRKNYQLAKSSVEVVKEKMNINNIDILVPFGISQSDVQLYLNASDLLLLTSFWEGSPNVVKEAMACNLPIISTDVGDVSEIISGTKNCFIVPFNENIIAEKIKIVYNNQSRSDGRERIFHLKDENIAEKIISLYSQVVMNENN